MFKNPLLRDAVREENDPPDLGREDLTHMPSDDPRMFVLKLRRKNQTNLLRKMLVDAGYGDLARMTAFRRERMDEGDRE